MFLGLTVLSEGGGMMVELQVTRQVSQRPQFNSEFQQFVSVKAAVTAERVVVFTGETTETTGCI